MIVENKDLANGCGIFKKIGPKPLAILAEMWVTGWALIDTLKEVIEKTLKRLILDKMKDPTPQKEQTKVKKLVKKQRW